MGRLYLIHIDPPYRHARHYLGYTSYNDVNRRVERHRSGFGSPLLAAAVKAGCTLHLALVVTGERKDERRLKRHSHIPSWCPICSRQWRYSFPPFARHVLPHGGG